MADGATSARGPGVSEPWDGAAPGVVTLLSGRRVRGRALRAGRPPGAAPEFGLYLAGTRPADRPWPSSWLRWPDFWLPTSAEEAAVALHEAWCRSATERVEVACRGGTGRTGTAMACLAVLDGVPAGQAVAFIRQRYQAKAVETPWQRRFVTRFGA